MANNENKEKTYLIKMPVYTTTMIEQEDGFFGKVTYQDMIQMVKGKIESFKGFIESSNRNKTKKTVIESVTCEDVNIGEIPALLLQISAYKTNMYDGYFEATEKIQISKDNKLGNDHNYVLLYPRITGYTERTYTCYFLMLVYEDPNKDNGEVCKIAKILANRILEIPIENIKLPMILKELSSLDTIPELEIKYHGIYESENDVDVKYVEYLTKRKSEKKKEYLFKNMPKSVMEQLLKDDLDSEEFTKKETKITVGKKEIRISRELVNEASQEIKETAEKIYNASSAIVQSELGKVFDKDFMIEKLTAVISNYLSYE